MPPLCSLVGCGQPAVLVWLRYNDVAQLTNVYSCGAHQINIDIAPLTHLATCTAPNVANLPNCDCQPVSILVAARA